MSTTRDPVLPPSLRVGPLRPDGLGPDSPSGARKFLHNPVLRAVLVVLLVYVLMRLAGLAAALAGWPDAVVILVMVGCAVAGYLVVAVRVEGRRPPVELAPQRWVGLLWGAGLGVVLFCGAFGILLLLGAYRITGIDTAGPWLVPALSMGLMAGVVEEILLRAGLHRLVEQGLGTWSAAAVSGLVFGLLHWSNPDGTLWGATAIALEAGLSFGLVYSLTRSLWVVIGLHAAWNLVQGLFFGAIVSGSGAPAPGLLVSEAVGPDWLTGGAFGPEASPVTVLAMLAWTVLLGLLLVRRRLVVAPIWTRRQHSATAAATVPRDAADR